VIADGNGGAVKKQALFILEERLTFKVYHGAGRLSPRMNLLVQTLQSFTGDVSINLGGGEVGMPEHDLDRAQVGAVFQQVGGEEVARGVGRDILVDTSLIAPLLDIVLEGLYLGAELFFKVSKCGFNIFRLCCNLSRQIIHKFEPRILRQDRCRSFFS
jgi:hypothetical protein